jgi:hypothetical protein
MRNVLKVSIAGQRIKYQVAKVTFTDSDLLKAKGWKWEYKGKKLYFSKNKLNILRDYETFDSADIGVAIRTTGQICYELGNTKGKISTDNVWSAENHPILIAISDANKRDGLTLVSADVFDKENTTYEYSLELGDNDFDISLLEIITIKDPITDENYIVELLYNGEKMKGGLDGLSFGDPMEDKSMYILSVPQEYADALGLGENKKLDNLLRFDDFIKEEYQKEGKNVKSAKGYVKLREDYIHSFIDAHERGVEPEEEE